MRDRPARRYTDPVIVRGTGAEVLRPLPLQPLRSDPTKLDETWFQDLIYNHPRVLPIAEIEPAFDGLIPLAREVPIKKTESEGFADALFVNSDGYVTLVEAKLYRNQEARSDVVGQVVDYLKEITTWSVLDLARAAARGRPSAVTEPTEDGLIQVLRRGSGEPIDDAAGRHWLDAIQRNLSRGRVLLVVVGDGVRENVAAMADFLQRSPQFAYTFGLVELLVFPLDDFVPGGAKLVVPQVLARTVNLERATVRLTRLRLRPTRHGQGTGEPRRSG